MKITEGIKISDNGFVFNSNTGDSFSLNPIGFELMKMIEASKDFNEIKESFLQKYEVNDLTFEKDFFEFLALLKYHQITIQGNPLDFV